MRLPRPFSDQRCAPARNDGFTLPEMLIALTIFLFVIAGIVYANLFGLSMFQMTNTKLNVTQWARETAGTLTDQIHGCAIVQVGNVTTNGVFQAPLDGETQQGNGLMIQPTTNAASYIIYFVNPLDQTYRQTDQSSNTVILADSVTNTVIFTAQDFAGNVLTNVNVNNQVIHLSLEFYQPQFFMQDADYYKLETSVTRRATQ